MKKIMIALLAIAVLFGFAACDNSSNTPADTETPNALDVFVSQYFNKLLPTLDARIESEYATINSLTSLSFSIKESEGVGSTPATSVVFNVTGEDITADEKATTRTIRLDSWTMNASDIVGGYSGLSYTVVDITGLAGALQGTVTIDNTDATAPVISDLQVERVFAPVACTSAVVSIGSADYDVDTADVLAQISASVPYTDTSATNPLLENYVTEEFYEAAMESVYKTEIQKYVSAALTALDTEEFAKYVGTSAVETGFTTGTANTESVATLKYTIPGGEADKDIVLATSGTASISLKKGTTFAISFESGDKGEDAGLTGTTFSPKEYTITEATFVVSGSADVSTVEGVTTDTSALVLTNVSGTITSGSITLASDKISSITAASGLGTPVSGTASVSDAAIYADTTDATGTVTVTYKN